MTEIIFRSIGYIYFGLTMEIVFTAMSKLFDSRLTKDDIRLKGNVSLWMIPVYGIFIVVLYEPLNWLLMRFNVFILARYLIWAVCISAIEALCGFLYDKFLHIRPWDYSKAKDRVFKNGYTRWLFVPMWGIAGLVLEVYSQLLINLSPYIRHAIDAIKVYGYRL